MPSYTKIGPSLQAQIAKDLIRPGIVSLRSKATVPEAVALMTDKGYHSAPVIDEAGRPIGVITQGDVLTHNREHGTHLAYSTSENLPEGFTEEEVDSVLVEDIMTPAVFCVQPNTHGTKSSQTHRWAFSGWLFPGWQAAKNGDAI
jgi:CBS domain-containing protein